MQAKGKQSKKILKMGIYVSLLSFILIVSCHYKTELYPAYDILKPDESVQIIGFTENKDIIVNESYIMWVESLKDEIIRLRKEIEKLKGGW